MKHHLLIVDDEQPIRDLLTEFFTRRGYDVTAVHSAKDVVPKIDEVKPHLVILDLALADGDGMEILGGLKLTHPEVPVVVLTGMGYDEDLLQEARSKGAVGYMSKTLPLEQLNMEVRRILKFSKGVQF